MTAPCSIPGYTPDASACLGGDATKCGPEKPLDITIPALTYNSQVGFHIDATNGRLTMIWDVAPSYPSQVVRMLYRRAGDFTGNYYDSPVLASRDGGTIQTIDGLLPGAIWEIWLRPETADKAGNWQHQYGITSDGWDAQQKLLIHRSEYVLDAANNYLVHGGP